MKKNIAAVIKYMYPQAEAAVDYHIFGNRNGFVIENWNEAKLGRMPTTEQIAAAEVEWQKEAVWKEKRLAAYKQELDPLRAEALNDYFFRDDRTKLDEMELIEAEIKQRFPERA